MTSNLREVYDRPRIWTCPKCGVVYEWVISYCTPPDMRSQANCYKCRGPVSRDRDGWWHGRWVPQGVQP